jgi:hypothetical protein
LIVVDPESRFTAKEALKHRFIQNVCFGSALNLPLQNTHTAPLHNTLAEGIKSLSVMNKAKREKKK